MTTANDNAIKESSDFDKGSLTIEDLEASLGAELESHFSELSFLEKERENISNPDNLGKIISEEIWKQFGNQLGLDMTNETLIQAYDRKNSDGYTEKVGNKIMQDKAYKDANATMKQQKTDGNLKDEYTGKAFNANDTANLDHVVSRKEIHENKRRKQANIDTKDLANKESNLAATNESLNKSKGAKSNKEYVEKRQKREETLRKKNETAHRKIDNTNKSEVDKRLEKEKADKRMQDKFDANDKLMLDKDAQARKNMNKDIYTGVAKSTAKKAGEDALKIMMVAALTALLKSIMNGLIRFFKEKHKTFKVFLNEMKEAIKQFVSKISNIVQSGANSGIGTVISELFGPIVSTFKRLASFIKQGVSSLSEAVRYLKAEENKNKPLSVKIAQVGKIVTAALAAGGAMASIEMIESALSKFPFMLKQIPLLGNIANITAVFLSSVIFGVIGAIIMNLIDRYIAKKQKDENLDEQVDKKNEILDAQNTLLDVKLQKLSSEKAKAANTMQDRRDHAKDIISDAMETLFYEEDEDDTSENLDAIGFELSELLK